MRHYQELPAYLARFDVALIPFALNESTQFVSPTKTLEYMAAHKPIISTPIRDVIALYGTVVRIAPDAQTFADQIQEALAESPSDRRAKEDNLLALYSWDHIAQQMASLIDKRLAAAIRLRKQNLRAAALVVDSSSNAAAAAGDR
jgi:glycosyltransferase involved in cell wall biosynthesis